MISDFGLGLPIGRDVSELQPIICPQSAVTDYEISESFRANSAKSPLSIKAVVRASGVCADEFRRMIGFEGSASLSKFREQLYPRYYPEATRNGQLEWRDDRERNEFTFAECYTVPKSFARLNEPGVYGLRITAHLMQQILVFPDSQGRKHPLALAHPRSLVHHISCEFETVYGSGKEFISVETREFRFEVRVSRQPGRDRYIATSTEVSQTKSRRTSLNTIERKSARRSAPRRSLSTFQRIAGLDGEITPMKRCCRQRKTRPWRK
jgi:hypothetical protein